MSVVYLNIGSNLGNREALINRAILLISEEFGYYCLSGFVESEPWGFESANPFLNIGMAIKTDRHPEEVLRIIQGIEKSISGKSHRDERGQYCDREIDIDIMLIKGMEYHSATLDIPHKHLFEREFFLKPLRELEA
ncbi:MAG: 2-amino-4-hydroxy-6-hydroxymethyldihydropteridine diphosphokinase [Muribaculaceae bacterium]|nr:2-amino-4-hydroxy-6-hydroxymethyldihydropteridine diphosphokinase [Muribaculaceae bacterium]